MWPNTHYGTGYINFIWMKHYNDVIMTTIASRITSLTIVYSTVYSDADQRKHQSSASLAFVWGIHRDRWIPHTKGQLRGKCFHLMTSSLYSSIAFQYKCIPVMVYHVSQYPTETESCLNANFIGNCDTRACKTVYLRCHLRKQTFLSVFSSWLLP